MGRFRGGSEIWASRYPRFNLEGSFQVAPPGRCIETLSERPDGPDELFRLSCDHERRVAPVMQCLATPGSRENSLSRSRDEFPDRTTVEYP